MGVVQAAATGVSLVEGERHRWQAGDPALAHDALRRLAVELVPADQREFLRRALQEGEEGPLPPTAAAVHRMLTADDPQRGRTLAQRLPRPHSGSSSRRCRRSRPRTTSKRGSLPRTPSTTRPCRTPSCSGCGRPIPPPRR